MPNLVAQATVYEFLLRDRFDLNVERVCALLRERRDALLAALAREFGSVACWNSPQGGYFVWLELPPEIGSAELLERARSVGVTFVPGTSFFPGGSDGASALRLAFSFVSAAELDEAVSRLAPLVFTQRLLRDARRGERAGPAAGA